MRRASLLLALLLAGCDKPAPTAGASTSAALAAPPPTTEAAPAVAPPDLDVAAQQRALKCGGEGKTGPCGVLAGMESCKAWNPVVPSGDGRWVGWGWVVEKGKTTDQFALVRARRVPSNDVGPGQLPVRISVTDLPKSEGAAWEQADRAIRAFARADVPPRGNPVPDYVKNRTDWPEVSALRTAGGNVYAMSNGGTYLCQGPNRALLVVQRASAAGAGGDGIYGQLWPTSW
jgi:hypothetical protein